MNVLELFAGSRSIGKVAERYGHNVFSVDFKDFEGIDLVQDIEFLTPDMIPFKPDVIWASPPCTCFSVASIGKHWNENNTPKTKEAILGVAIVQKTLDIVNHFLSINPYLKYYIENPRGKLRSLPILKHLERTTIWYCQYGDHRAKPTDIWSNNIYNPMFNQNGWKPRPQCWNGNKKCHHEEAPRGSKTGTQGMKDNYERSKLPTYLCEEIIKSI